MFINALTHASTHSHTKIHSTVCHTLVQNFISLICSRREICIVIICIHVRLLLLLLLFQLVCVTFFGFFMQSTYSIFWIGFSLSLTYILTPAPSTIIIIFSIIYWHSKAWKLCLGVLVSVSEFVVYINISVLSISLPLSFAVIRLTLLFC